MNESLTLEKQFKSLQKSQQQKDKALHKMKQSYSASTLDRDSNPTFRINDDLNLSIANPFEVSDENEISILNTTIRELKDENGRLMKLLNEKNFEIKQIQKKWENHKYAAESAGAVPGDAAAIKIVDLTKRIRQLNSELEVEKTKLKQVLKKCSELEKQIAGSSNKPEVNEMKPDASSSQSTENLLKTSQDKLKQSELRNSDLRNQCQALKQDLKMAHKVLSNELGEEVSIHSILNSNSGWRGRAQQIAALQNKIVELKSQLGVQRENQDNDYDLEAKFMGTVPELRGTTKSAGSIDERHREQIRKIEKTKKEINEKTMKDKELLEQDVNNLKQKLDAAKARSKVQSNEIKSQKEQIQNFNEKSKHDNELICTLIDRYKELTDTLSDESRKLSNTSNCNVDLLDHLEMKNKQENSEEKHLKVIMEKKNEEMKKLENKINELNLMLAQKREVTRLFDQCDVNQVNLGSDDSSTHPEASKPDWYLK